MLKKRKKLIIISLTGFVGLALIGIAILFVSGLQSQEKQTQPGNGSEAVDNSSDVIDGLPADFPVYNGSEIKSYAVSKDGTGKSFIWETEAETSLVFEFLKSDLRIKDWAVSNDFSFGSSSTLSFEKNGNYGFLGVFKDGSGKTLISVTIR
jgi:hypothetical protein